MRITHLSTYDLNGGAALAAYRLHRGLCASGEESRFLALSKSSSDPTVIEFAPPRNLFTRIRRALTRRALERSGRELLARPSGATFFTDDRSQHAADVLRQLPESDVLNLHWIAGFFDYRRFFSQLPARLPIVWTLHDMNAFTGGCHYDEGCGKFSAQCGACPQLDSPDAADFSRRVWERKREAYSSLEHRSFHVVTPSRWLAHEARQSSLFSNQNVSVIPYGINLDSFQPRDRRAARNKYDIPNDVKVVLFVAVSAKERRKGMHVLLEALRDLREFHEVLFVAVGSGLGDITVDRFKRIEPLADEEALSYVYSLADVFVIPSLQDNLPNTALEALACGVPTIGSKAGGIPEVVRDGETGYLVPPGDAGALREAIASSLDATQKRESMSKESRRIAVEQYSLKKQATTYEWLYRQLSEGGVK